MSPDNVPQSPSWPMGISPTQAINNLIDNARGVPERHPVSDERRLPPFADMPTNPVPTPVFPVIAQDTTEDGAA